MKNIYVLLLGMLLYGKLYAQHLEQCGYKLVLQEMEQRFPGYISAEKNAFAEAERNSTIESRNAQVYNIPVVFHILYKPTVPAQNLHDSIIVRQIEIMNRDFAAANDDLANLRSIFGITAQDAQIRFYLANTDPNGNTTTGIERRSTSTSFAFNPLGGSIPNKMKFTAQGGLDAWNTERYMNIWVCDMADAFFGISVLGFAFPPVGLNNWPANSNAPVGEDGLCIQYQFISDNNPALATVNATFQQMSNKGRTVIHESGHYFGLRHIWADKGNPLTGAPSCTGDDDGIADTPFCGGNSQTDGCLVSKNTCGAGTSGDLPDMWENYMDYSRETCQVLFTPGQVAHMQGTLNTPTQRGNLWNWDITNIENVNSKNQISMFPNPAQNHFNIEFKDEYSKHHIRVINAQGKEIYSIKYIGSLLPINIQSWAKGVYQLVVQTEKYSITEKLIVQ